MKETIKKEEDYENLRQILKIRPEMAEIMLERAGVPKEEREKFLAEDALRPENDDNESGSGRKLEPETIRAMLEQFNFSEEEIEKFFAEK